MVNMETLRRYLQPSPSLRWHPWAPLVAGFLVIAFIFVLGAQWGYSAARRDKLRTDHYGAAFTVRGDYLSRYPARDVMRHAGVIDAVVSRYLGESQEQPGPWQRVRGNAEKWLFRGGREPFVMSRSSVVDLAEFRLRELSGSAPRWQVTSAYCDEATSTLSGKDLRNSSVAEAYTTLLGRKISPEELAPAVPGARCEPSRRMQ